MLTEGYRCVLFPIVHCQFRSFVFSLVWSHWGQVFARPRTVGNSKQHSSGLLLACTVVRCRYSPAELTRKLTVLDFIESFTTLFITRFLTTDSLITGPYCTFQAVGLISGVIGSAIWTLVITVNTFLLLIGGRNMRAWVIEKSSSGWERWVLSIAIWIFVLLSGLFGFIKPVETDKGPYCIDPLLLGWLLDDQLGTGWCYIGQNYRWESIFFTYGNIL